MPADPSTPCPICAGTARAEPIGGLILVECDVCGRVAWLSVEGEDAE
jgi:hypothetical protein